MLMTMLMIKWMFAIMVRFSEILLSEYLLSGKKTMQIFLSIMQKRKNNNIFYKNIQGCNYFQTYVGCMNRASCMVYMGYMNCTNKISEPGEISVAVQSR